MANIILKNPSTDTITFKQYEQTGKHSFVYKIKHNKRDNFIIQTPKLLVRYIPTVYTHKNYCFYKLCLEMDRMEFDPEVKRFVKFLEKVDKYVQEKAGKMWTSIGYSKKRKKFKPSVCYKQENGKGFSYFNIQVYNNKPEISIFDWKKEKQQLEYIMPGSRAYSLLWLDSVWFKSNKFGLNWVILQMKVYLPIYRIEECLIEDDTDNKAQDSSVSASSCATAEASSMVPLREHPVFCKFFKMKKFGIPVPSIQQKLQMEQLDPHIINLSETLLVDPDSDVVPDDHFTQSYGKSATCHASAFQVSTAGTTTAAKESHPSSVRISHLRRQRRASAPTGGLMGVLAGLGSVKLRKTKIRKKAPVKKKPRDNRVPSLEEILNRRKSLKRVNTHKFFHDPCFDLLQKE